MYTWTFFCRVCHISVVCLVSDSLSAAVAGVDRNCKVTPRSQLDSRRSSSLLQLVSERKEKEKKNWIEESLGKASVLQNRLASSVSVSTPLDNATQDKTKDREKEKRIAQEKKIAADKKRQVHEAHGLHRVVGEHGVLMITLTKDLKRFNHSREALAKAGIYPTILPGVDGRDPATPQDMLDKACTAKGCGKREFQALVESHRRALVQAQKRERTWTAIFEDDVIPDLDFPSTGWERDENGMQRWMREFDHIWDKLPPKARFVRLGRCMIKTWPEGKPSHVGMKNLGVEWAGRLKLTQWTGIQSTYVVGGCTHAYMVHKEIIPELLSILPCNCALDCCLEWNYFNKQGQKNVRGLEILYNIDTQLSPDESFAKAASNSGLLKNVMQYGILEQDWAGLPDGITAKGFAET